MKKWLLGIIVMMLLGFLIACGDGETKASEEEEVKPPEEQVEEETKKQEGEIDADTPVETVESLELSTDEAREIVEAHFKQLDEAMGGIQAKHPDKPSDFAWIREYDVSHPEYKAIYEDTREAFSDLVHEDSMEKIASNYILTYFCHCDTLLTFDEKELVTRFQIIEQAEDAFTISYLTLDRILGLDPSTNYLTYVKRGNHWLLADSKSVSPEEEPMNLTAEDLLVDQVTGGAGEFVEMVTEDEQEYIVMKYGDVYQVRNTANSYINWELENRYNDPSTSEAEQEETSRAQGTIIETVGLPYETVTLAETEEAWEVTVSYPVFSINPLDAVIAEKMEAMFQEEVSDYTEPDEVVMEFGEINTFAMEFGDIVATEKFVSVLFHGYSYQGGVHGYHWTTPFNYDLEQERVMELQDVLNGDLSNIDALTGMVYERLMLRNDVFDAASVETHLYEDQAAALSDFSLTQDSVIFYFQPYAVGPYASGVIEVEITYEELEAL